MATSSRVRDLIREWLSSDERGKARLAGELYDHLETANESRERQSDEEHFSGFTAPLDVYEFLDGIGIPGNTQWPETPDELADALLAELGRPIHRWAFEAPVAVWGTLSLDEEIGGRAELRLFTPTEQQGLGRLRLKGVVGARTGGAAVAMAEANALAVLGAANALGLVWMDYRPPQSTSASASLSVAGASQESTLAFQSIVDGAYADYVDPPTDLERAHLSRGDVRSAMQRQIGALRRLFTASSLRARHVRRLCEMAARAAAASDYGIAVTLAFSVVEGLLLDPLEKGEVHGRLVEAIAFSLGSSVEQRTELRKQTKRLYDHRSTFVHRGNMRESAGVRDEALTLMKGVLRREVDLIR